VDERHGDNRVVAELGALRVCRPSESLNPIRGDRFLRAEMKEATN
jgi:hypothetical protein